MISIEIIKYSLKNLMNRKTRAFLTILSIFVGIATIFIFISFGLGLYNYMNTITSSSAADKILIQAKGATSTVLDTTFKLDDEDLKVVKNTLGVIEATGVYIKVAEIKQKRTRKYVFLSTIDPEKPLLMETSNIGIEKGRKLKKNDDGKIVLGYNFLVPDRIFEKSYDIGDKIMVQGQKLEIVGFMESIGSPTDDSSIYITNDYLKKLYSKENNSYNWIVAKVDIKNIDKVINKVKKNLRNHRGLEEGKEDFFVQSWQDLIDTYSNILNIIIGFIVLIALISVFVSAINTTNTMVTSVLERTKEIGILKSIGAKNIEIFKIFLFESSFLGFVAGIFGVLVGWSISFIGGNILNNLGWGFLTPYFPNYLFVGCILFATITGAISGAIPAYRASKTKIVDSLRYE